MINTHLFFKAIQHSFRFLDLENGWDGEDADTVNFIAFNNAHIILHKLIKESITRNIQLEIPEINLCRDGSIDIDWSLENGYQFLINVTDKGFALYGDDGKYCDRIKKTCTVLQDVLMFTVPSWIFKNLAKI